MYYCVIFAFCQHVLNEHATHATNSNPNLNPNSTLTHNFDISFVRRRFNFVRAVTCLKILIFRRKVLWTKTEHSRRWMVSVSDIRSVNATRFSDASYHGFACDRTNRSQLITFVWLRFHRVTWNAYSNILRCKSKRGPNSLQFSIQW